MAKKYDMTIQYAIDELKQISKRTNDDKVVAKIGCAIADLKAYMEVNREDRTIDEVIAEHIERKRSQLDSINSHWASKLNHDIYEMIHEKELNEKGQDLIAKIKGCSQELEKLRAEKKECSDELKEIEKEKSKSLNELKSLQSEAIKDSNEAIDVFWQYHKHNKKKHKWFTFGVCALIFVAALVTFLSCFVELFMGWGGVVGALIGLADFAFGLIFQVYERNDDMKQKSALATKTNNISEKEEAYSKTKEAYSKTEEAYNEKEKECSEKEKECSEKETEHTKIIQNAIEMVSNNIKQEVHGDNNHTSVVIQNGNNNHNDTNND